MNVSMKHTLYGVGAGLLTVSLGAGVLLSSAVHAADVQNTNAAATTQAVIPREGGFGKMHGGAMMGKHPLIEALGLTDAEITALKSDTSGKTLTQLLAEKGVTQEQLKAKELAKITENFGTEFDKRYLEMKDKKVSELLMPPARPEGKGKMMRGAKLSDAELATKLGITAEALAKAKTDGTLKDLMKAKMSADRAAK
ncbi:MAG: hypothetical protein ACK4NC_04365 [Candidatus Gracilibacteria bacterium]